MDRIEKDIKEYYNKLGLETISSHFTTDLVRKLPRKKMVIEPLINKREWIQILVCISLFVLITSYYGLSKGEELAQHSLGVDWNVISSLSKMVALSIVAFCTLLLVQFLLITKNLKLILY